MSATVANWTIPSWARWHVIESRRRLAHVVGGMTTLCGIRVLSVQPEAPGPTTGVCGRCARSLERMEREWYEGGAA